MTEEATREQMNKCRGWKRGMQGFWFYIATCNIDSLACRLAAQTGAGLNRQALLHRRDAFLAVPLPAALADWLVGLTLLLLRCACSFRCLPLLSG